MEPKRLMIARFPYPDGDHPDVTDFVCETAIKAKLDPRISSLATYRISDTPITMGRNLAIEKARADKADFLLIIDSDMKADAYLASNPHRLDTDSSARPFWDSSFEFMWRHYERGPCIVASPYCGPPPFELVFVFRWANAQTDHPNADLRIEPYSREEAIQRSGFEEVACLPTGLMLIDMRVFDHPLVQPPYFCYEWTDKREMKKASTEDCFFTRNITIANIPIYVNWDAWSGHWKKKCVGRPKPIFREQVHKTFVDAVLRNISRDKKLVFVQEHDGEQGSESSGNNPQPAASNAGGGDHGPGPGQDGGEGFGPQPPSADDPGSNAQRGKAIGIRSRRAVPLASDGA